MEPGAAGHLTNTIRHAIEWVALGIEVPAVGGGGRGPGDYANYHKCIIL